MSKSNTAKNSFSTLRFLIHALILLVCNNYLVVSFPTHHASKKSMRSWGMESNIGSKYLLHSTTTPNGNDPGKTFMDSLRARQCEIGREKSKRVEKWRNAECSSGVALGLPDWVRRFDVEYPLMACGSCSDTIFVANLETGNVLAESPKPDQKDVASTQLKNVEQTLSQLYGDYDGGGTIAIAFQGDLICESNRDGGIKIWRLDSDSSKLVSQGKMKAFDDVLVTCLHMDEEYLWIGTQDGRVEAFSLDSNLPLAMQTVPDLYWKFDSTILSLSFCLSLNCGVATLAGGRVEVFSLEDDEESLCSFYPPWSSQVHALSGRIVEHNNEEANGSSKYSIVAAGNDGSLYLQPLQLDEDGEIDVNRPFTTSLRKLHPKHSGAIKCLANPIPGLLVSAGHDGSMRVWDVDSEECLYQFVGYKVWLGSLWTDGSRIISDGSDNTIVVHDFAED